jgi:hypothetical protein
MFNPTVVDEFEVEIISVKPRIYLKHNNKTYIAFVSAHYVSYSDIKVADSECVEVTFENRLRPTLTKCLTFIPIKND